MIAQTIQSISRINITCNANKSLNLIANKFVFVIQMLKNKFNNFVR